MFAAPEPVSFSSKPDRTDFVGHTFDGKDEQGEIACHMRGKSCKGINIHRIECRKRMEKLKHFIL